MALIPCPECHHQVSDTATSCPNCGFRLKPPPIPLHTSTPTKSHAVPLPIVPKKKSYGCAIITMILFVLILIQLLSGSSSNRNSISPSIPNSESKVWYTGGTLHSKRLSDWRYASFDNKLATCADWAANIKIKKGENYNGDLKSMRADALLILSCLDEVAKNPKIEMPLVDIVASCAILMKMY